MTKDRWLLRSVLLLALSALLMTTALAAEAGSTGDPLVTLSYLNETFSTASCSGWTRKSPSGTAS